jgi:hypothetical protein
MELHKAMRVLRAAGLQVVMAGGRKERALAAAGAPAVHPGYPGESAAAREYRMQVRARLQAEARDARARELMGCPAVRAAAAPVGPDPSDYAPFPADPWPGSDTPIPRPVERPVTILAADDFCPCPEPNWSAAARRRDGGVAPARRDDRAAEVDTGYAPAPPNPWGA